MTGDDDGAIDFSVLSPLHRADALSLYEFTYAATFSASFFSVVQRKRIQALIKEQKETQLRGTEQDAY